MNSSGSIRSVKPAVFSSNYRWGDTIADMQDDVQVTPNGGDINPTSPIETMGIVEKTIERLRAGKRYPVWSKPSSEDAVNSVKIYNTATEQDEEYSFGDIICARPLTEKPLVIMGFDESSDLIIVGTADEFGMISVVGNIKYRHIGLYTKIGNS